MKSWLLCENLADRMDCVLVSVYISTNLSVVLLSAAAVEEPDEDILLLLQLELQNMVIFLL